MNLPLSRSQTLQTNPGMVNNATVPGIVAANGTDAFFTMHGSASSPNANGVTFKRDDSTYGTASAYGSAQPWVLLSPSSQAASDTTGDYNVTTPGSNPVLARDDAYGGYGNVQGIHINPGLRDTYGGPTPIGLWTQLGYGGVDAVGVMVTMPAAGGGYVAPGICVSDSTASNRFFAADTTGAAVYSTGATAAISLFAGAAGSSNLRSLFKAVNVATTPIALQAAAGQTADFMDLFASDGVTKLSKFDSSGYLWLPGDPTSANQAATKHYVDNGGSGGGGGSLNVVKCVATINEALTGLPVIDSYQTLNSDVVLLTGQTTASQNGPWQLPASGSGAWTRPTWFASGAVVTGTQVSCLAGTLLHTTDWMISTASAVTVDATAHNWQMVGGSYFQGILTDGGSLQQWTASTPTQAQSIWAYQGIIYMRLTTGTDSSWTRTNWVEIGADPTVVGGGELAYTQLSSTFSAALAANTFTDITGLNASPVMPSSGRPVYAECLIGATSSVAANGVSIRLYDVTAGAVAQDAHGNTTGIFAAYQLTASKGYNVQARWRLAPAGGSRTYKIQASVTLAATLGVLGEDFGFEGYLSFVAH